MHYLANLLLNRAYTKNILVIKKSKAISYNKKEINDTFKILFKQLYASQFNKFFTSTCYLTQRKILLLKACSFTAMEP